jgi:8-oxo-dGTP pyrophosphatase MutT (NUDIX family)
MKPVLEHPLAVLRAVLPQTPPDSVGRDEYAAYPEMRPDGQAGGQTGGQAGPIAAAVLIPVIARETSQGGPSILFTRRTDTLARHSGQISFPGGRREAHDPTPLETALRETMEETGIDPAFVSIAGFLPRYLTGTGFDITPVVGVVAPGFALMPDAKEVAEIFEVKLAFFLDPANVREISREMAGRPRRMHVFEPDGRYIWGITAALLCDLAGRLNAPHAIEPP